MKENERKKRSVMIGAAIISVICMLLALGKTEFSGKAQNAAFTPPPFEEAAEIGTPDLEKMDETLASSYQTLEAGIYQVAVCGQPQVNGKEMLLYLTNPETNQVWLKVRVLDEDGTPVGESGILKPGEYVPAVSLNEAVTGQEIRLKIMAYEPETYHSAGAITLKTEIKGGAR